MTDRDPEKTLKDWKSEMQAEHAEAITSPDSEADHRIEGVTQVNYRVYFEYDEATGQLERSHEKQVDELSDPELRSCSCGVRGMTPDEAREHIEAAREQSYNPGASTLKSAGDGNWRGSRFWYWGQHILTPTE